MVLVITGLLWATSYSMMLVKMEQKYLENLAHHIRGHSIIKFALSGDGVPSKCRYMQTGEKGHYVTGDTCFPYTFF